jgi:outer membrane receptor for ferrienterochelin and colicins
VKKHTYLLIVLLTLAQLGFGQKHKTDAHVIGHVVSMGEHLPFVNVSVKGTTIGTTTDETGHFQLLNLPAGKFTVMAQFMGFKRTVVDVDLREGETREVKFELKPDLLGLEEVVVTGNRYATKRRESTTIVNTISPKLFSTAQAISLSDGLNFTPGLRMENNCQNCGFSQLRMNGLEGPYTQILINSRPIFSGLAGVYGLELIPANIIDRIEIVRGGGSALYGSNAIAGTVNLILKEPINNAYELGINGSMIGLGNESGGNVAPDIAVNFNTSVVSPDNKTGMSLYGFYRDRQPYDANKDSFSEIASLKNTTIGTRFFHRFGMRGKIIADIFNIKESRRGGDKFDSPEHEANIAESVDHNLTTAALSFEQFVRKNDLLSLYASSQLVNRDSYYGANQSLSDYGKTDDFSFVAGAQYNMRFKKSNLIFGVEDRGEWLKDKKLGYPDYANAIVVNDSITKVPHTNDVTIADQFSNTFGLFSQYEIQLSKLKISLGARFDTYQVDDRSKNGELKTGNVLSPRLNLLYDLGKSLQARISYSQGYRAPQIFDEDLHIETSGSRKVIHVNSPDLKQETSHSFTGSLDYKKQFGTLVFGFLAEAFYTQLNDPFANEYSEPQEDGTVIYTRINAKKGAVVQGINLEMNLVPNKFFSLKSGFTIQSSKYQEAIEFNERRFFRTPNDYGYLTLEWSPFKNWGMSSTANYTGKMLLPYFGLQAADPKIGELRESDAFLELGLKFRHNIKINGATLQLFAGMKNIFNSFQDDFDYGIDRDPGYVYGPMQPRTLYFGFKIGNTVR